MIFNKSLINIVEWNIMYNNATATVSRFEYVNNKATGRKPVGVFSWYFTEINPQELSSPDLYGKMFHFSIADNVDIKESDKVEINNKSYSVKTVLKKKGRMLALTRCVLLEDA